MLTCRYFKTGKTEARSLGCLRENGALEKWINSLSRMLLRAGIFFFSAHSDEGEDLIVSLDSSYIQSFMARLCLTCQSSKINGEDAGSFKSLGELDELKGKVWIKDRLKNTKFVFNEIE